MEVIECFPSDLNGFFLCDKFLVKELVSQILILADFKSILKCRLVCKQWNAIIADLLFWKHKVLWEKKRWPKIPQNVNFPWNFYASIYLHGPLDRNLLKNPNGKEKLLHWNILSQGGDGFGVENPPAGSDVVPLEAENSKSIENTCFATSYHSCSKEQIVDLTSLGIKEEILNNFRPKFIFTDWYAGRFDCGCVYESHFALLGKSKEIIADFTFRGNVEQWQGSKWNKVEHIFQNYSEDVRYLKFYHGGTDRQFWAGHYGVKMTGSSIIMTFT